MNDKIKLSSELQSSKFSNGGYKRNSQVDIKGICQKFENLSTAVAESNVPVAPLRRKKINHNVTNIITRNSSNQLKPELSNGIKISTAKTYNAIPSSVKERTKLFESPVVTDKSLLSPSCIKLKKVDNKSDNHLTSPDNFTIKNEKDTMNKNTPPAKPPRTFLHADCNANSSLTEKFDVRDKKSVNVKEVSQVKLENKFKSSPNSSKTNEPECVTKNSRLGSAPELLTGNAEKSSTPKITKYVGKTPLKNYFKNITSTANNICEKLKQSSIFVDLTPTTVSPPKHYGTLKRSMSEEHIYAELTSVNKSPDSDKSKSPVTEPLHYMCTSLVPPTVPRRTKIEENGSVSSISVRSMIYGSFAGLRATVKENSESVTGSPASDSTEIDLSVKAIQERIIYVKSVRKQASSSSICLAPKLYEALFIVNIVDDQPQVAHSFPLKVDAEYNIPLLPHICFPDNSLFKSVSVYQSEVFHFSLTDREENIFGHCLRIQGWPESSSNVSLCVKLPVAVCILSSFRAPVFYRKLLFEIEKHLSLPRNSCFKYIRSLRKLGVPNAGASLSIPDISEKGDESKRIVISRPLDSHFVGFEMTRALQLLDVDILVKSVASLFLERRILLFSASTSNLYHCCKAISSLLYPFEWPHHIVPVLPACLTIHCCSDQPYILGVINNNNCDSVLELLAEHELLIIDVDKGAIIKSCNDEDTILPRKVQKAVISALNLAKNMTDPTEMLRDIMISEAFVHMSVEMIGHYENHFTEISGNAAFQKEIFLKNAFSHNIRSFLQWFTETQMFDSFIEDSLWRIKYRDICQTHLRTFFEKRVDEYKWELTHGNEKLTRIIGKTVRNFGEMLKGLKKC